MDLQNLSLDELRKLLPEVQNTIKAREQEELQKARQEILSIADRIGVPIDALLLTSTKDKKQRNKVAVQYRHPDDASKEWTGRGRQPKWIKEFVDAGGSLEQLRLARS